MKLKTKLESTHRTGKPAPEETETSAAFAELKRRVHAALETYSNVHRGSGHHSQVTTHLYEQAREIVLEYLGLQKEAFEVIFCTPWRAERLKAHLKPGRYQIVSSQEIGLPLGIQALVVERRALPGGIPFQTGGGTARLVSPGWVIWAKAPDRFEAGTPPIINVIAFAIALRLLQRFGKDAFHAAPVGAEAQDGTAQRPTDLLYHDELEPYTGRALLHELRQTLVGRGVRVPTLEGARPFINLDNGASTPTFAPVWDAVWQSWRQPWHAQQEVVREVKAICAETLNAPLAAYDVIFTSNTTDAINLAAECLRKQPGDTIQPVVVNTLLEHNSNELPWRRVPGVSMIRLPVDSEGFVDLKELEDVLSAYNQQGRHGKKRIELVAMSGASNVLGVFNDLRAVAQIVHRYGARLLVDAAQLVAHRKVEMEACGIDYLVFSAHKVYAPFGTGVLVARKGLLHFSTVDLEQIQSSGEENVGGIAALGKALVLLRRIGLDLIQEEEQVLTARCLRGLRQIPGIEVYGIKDPDSPQFASKGGVIPYNLGDVLSSRVATELAEQGGIGVRAGCHCAHMLIKHFLHIPPAFQLLQGVLLILFPEVALPGVVRVSLGIENDEADIKTLIEVMGKIARQPHTGIDNPFAAKPTQPQTEIQRQMEGFVQDAAQNVYGVF